MNIQVIKKHKKIISIIATIFVIIVTMFLLAEKVHLMEHNHCSETQCPICDILYIVNKELKNVSLGNNSIKIALLMTLMFIVPRNVSNRLYVKELSLVGCKVRLND